MIQYYDVFGRIQEVSGNIIHLPPYGLEVNSIVGFSNGSSAQIIRKKNSEALALHRGDGLLPKNSDQYFLKALEDKADLGESVLGAVIGSNGEELYRAFFPNKIPKKKVSLSPTLRALEDRVEISEQLVTQIPILDLLVPIGKGQRLLILAEPGIGKTTLVKHLLKQSSADKNVLALIGERAREVQEFSTKDLSEDLWAKTTIFASTSSESAAQRARSLDLAIRQAEVFAEKGEDVLLIVDSCTRVVRAWREMALAVGEIPIRKGYPPSIFQKLPNFVERAGAFRNGSITLLFTLLDEGDGTSDDPIAQELKSLVDGHILLSREIFQKGLFPAVDPIRSLSRVADSFLSPESLQDLHKAKALFSYLEELREAEMIGGRERSEGEKEREKRLFELLYSVGEIEDGRWMLREIL
jgi:FliI/YscN family ATPase